MSLHKLWAGSGYAYLTRQVAALDATDLRGSLASYYSERGETPGVWVGAGLVGVEGLASEDVVAADQMQALFGRGEHPLAAERRLEAELAGQSPRDVSDTGRLGAPYRSRTTSTDGFADEVNRRLQAHNPSLEQLEGVRSSLVSEVAAEWFARDQGRPPLDARELADAVARYGRRPAQPVAGYDLTFSPVKSVSALWAVADRPVAAAIEQAHHAAVEDALRFLEQHALFSREGAQGVRSVEVRGLVAAAFTHRDSRAGDPDLHTHVAVANKVQTLDGKWLAIDGRVLHAAATCCSETYNTRLEAHLGDRVGLRFADRDSMEGLRPVREVVGVDPRLTARWSSRRQAIDVRRAELASAFQERTGRPPTPAEGIGLAQQATLQTRNRKHEPRTLDEQRVAWHDEAAAVLGGTLKVTNMVTTALAAPRVPLTRPDAGWVAATAARVITRVEGERATWQEWHVRAEALRQARYAGLPAGTSEHLVDLVVRAALDRSVPLTPESPADPGEPGVLRRRDGSSVYRVAGSAQYTSQRNVDAEQRVLDLAARRDGRRVDRLDVDLAIALAGSRGHALNEGQASLVRELATSGRRLQLALAPAGTGKTTALRAVADAWTTSGGSVVALAPSAAAAAVLGEQLGQPADTLAKLAWHLRHADLDPPGWVRRLGERSLVLVDEAGMADTLTLASVLDQVIKVGGSVRLVGDDRQLGAVGAGGLLTDLAAAYGVARLTDVVRFADPAEAAASLALRDGKNEALGFYLDARRIHLGDAGTAPHQLFAAWARDRAANLDSVMLAPTNTLAADLNHRARQQRLQGKPSGAEVLLADGNLGSTGDLILCRRNNRQLATSRTDWIRNGDRLHLVHVHPDGSVTARRRNRPGQVRLPPDYVTEWVQLGYASTIHAAQGLTCDTVHGLLTGTEDRAQLYTLLTRGRTANHLYLIAEADQGLHDLTRPGDAPAGTAVDVLERMLQRDRAAHSATSVTGQQADPAARLADAVDRYVDGLHLAADHTSPDADRQRLQERAEQLVPGLTDDPAWPTLRSSLLLTGNDRGGPERRLLLAVASGPVDGAGDRAAVLHHRVTGMAPLGAGPLPWLPAIPARLIADPSWGSYLQARHTEVTRLTDDVRRASIASVPAWRPPPPDDEELVAQVAIFRAARQVPDADRRPTGPPVSGLSARWQSQLDQQLLLAAHLGMSRPAEPPNLASPAANTLQQRIDYLAALGVDTSVLLPQVTNQTPLPDQHADAAIWWRLYRHLPARLLDQAAREAPVTPASSLAATPRGRDRRVELAAPDHVSHRHDRQPPRPSMTP